MEATPGDEDVMNASITSTPVRALLKLAKSLIKGSLSLTCTGATHLGLRIG